jgi:hypothetical protein
MSAKKIGRPPLPKNQIKADLIGVRVKPNEAKKIAEFADKNDETPAEIMRQATEDYLRRPPLWVRSKWKASQLHDKRIRFVTNLTGGTYEVTGDIFARERANGEISIKVVLLDTRDPMNVPIITYHLPQRIVDTIIEADTSDGVDFKTSELI